MTTKGELFQLAQHIFPDISDEKLEIWWEQIKEHYDPFAENKARSEEGV